MPTSNPVPYYRLLGVYTGTFGDCSNACHSFVEAGLVVEPVAYFFGCATGVIGRKP